MTALPRPAARSGVVLLLVLFCLLAIEVTVVGVHYVALRELQTARAVVRNTHLRLGAQAAANRALAGWAGHAIHTLAIFDTITLPAASGSAPGGVLFGATAERLGGDLLLVRATAASPLRETAGIGVLVALASPADLASNAAAALTVSGAVGLASGATVSEGTACVGDTAARAAVQVAGPDAITLDGGIIQGRMLTDGPLAPEERFGPLRHSVFEDAAVVVAASSVVPRSAVSGVDCDTGAPDNWGDPADPASPCAGYFPILHRPGDMVLGGGAGQGILVVDGTLTMTGARFDGLIIARGDVRLDQGAQVNGALIVDGSVSARDGAAVLLDRCALAESLRDIRVRGPFKPAGRTWIPLF